MINVIEHIYEMVQLTSGNLHDFANSTALSAYLLQLHLNTRVGFETSTTSSKLKPIQKL